MGKKHNAVKKGGAHAMTYAVRRAAEKSTQDSFAKFGGQVEMQDAIIIALGRMQKNHRAKWFAKFNAELTEVYREIRMQVKEDAESSLRGKLNVDATKVKIDREMKKYLGENFAGFDYRWSPDRKFWGLAAFPPDYEGTWWTPEQDAALKEKANWTIELGAK